MVVSFKDADCELFWKTGKSRRVAVRKLAWLHAAVQLEDLRIPPSNHLKALQGDRLGRHSIWINDQYRLCFVWNAESASEVEIVDYH